MFPDLLRDDVFRLETRRLWLRWPRHADAVHIARQAGDKEVAEMTAVMPHPYPPGEAERFVFEARADNAAGRRLSLVLARTRGPGEAIGVIGLRPDTRGILRLGYWLGRDHWGQGLMGEAVEAVLDATFRFTEFDLVAACVRVDNPASRRVLERAGFAFTGSGREEFPARGEALLIDRFTLDRETWAALRPRVAKGVAAVRAGFVPGHAFERGLAVAAE